jgi:hypothetical protein
LFFYDQIFFKSFKGVQKVPLLPQSLPELSKGNSRAIHQTLSLLALIWQGESHLKKGFLANVASLGSTANATYFGECEFGEC